MAVLSQTEVAAFRQDGFVQINRPILPEAAFGRLGSIFEDLLAIRGADRLDVPHFDQPCLFDFLFADEILDLVEPLIGPDIGLWSSHFICKAAHAGLPTPWHEDSAYWDGRISTMDGIVTVWLAIDAVDRSNGAMAVIPGTHRSGPYDYEQVALTGEVFDRQIVPGRIDPGQARYARLLPNECTLHDARIVHGAEANVSDRRRAGYTMRYFPTTSRVIPEKNASHRVWLARGQDRAGNRFAPRP